MKVVNINNISSLSAKTMITVGMFDGVHVGHQHILSMLLSRSAELRLDPVVVTFDCHPRVVLGLADDSFRQLMTTDERLSALEAFGIPTVALVHFTPEVAALSACQFARHYLVQRLNVGALVLGYDNMFGSKQTNDFHLLPRLAEECGFSLVSDSAVLQEGLEISSTRIRNALHSGDIGQVNSMLGTAFSLSGTVVHGRHVGHSIGFPTANIEVADPHKAIPAPGVYAVRVCLDSQEYCAMANVGARPTFAVEKQAIEVHLFDFEGDLYDRDLTLRFDSRMRDVCRFDSVDSLVAQIAADRDRIRHYYETPKQ